MPCCSPLHLRVHLIGTLLRTHASCMHVWSVPYRHKSMFCRCGGMTCNKHSRNHPSSWNLKRWWMNEVCGSVTVAYALHGMHLSFSQLFQHSRIPAYKAALSISIRPADRGLLSRLFAPYISRPHVPTAVQAGTSESFCTHPHLFPVFFAHMPPNTAACDIDTKVERWTDIKPSEAAAGEAGGRPKKRARTREPLHSVVRLLPEYFPDELYSSSDRRYGCSTVVWYRQYSGCSTAVAAQGQGCHVERGAVCVHACSLQARDQQYVCMGGGDRILHVLCWWTACSQGADAHVT